MIQMLGFCGSELALPRRWVRGLTGHPARYLRLAGTSQPRSFPSSWHITVCTCPVLRAQRRGGRELSITVIWWRVLVGSNATRVRQNWTQGRPKPVEAPDFPLVGVPGGALVGPCCLPYGWGVKSVQP